MEFSIKSEKLSQSNADVIIVGIHEGNTIEKQLLEFDKDIPTSYLNGLEKIAAVEEFSGKLNQKLILPIVNELNCKQLVLLGLGKEDQDSNISIKRQAANLARELSKKGSINRLLVFMPDTANRQAEVFAEGFCLGGFKFDKYKTNGKDKAKSNISQIDFFQNGNSNKQDQDKMLNAATQGQIIAEAINFSRRLIAEPAGFMTPKRLAKEVEEMAQGTTLKVEVLSKQEIEKEKMGCLLGVAQGAKQEPVFIVMRYEGKKGKKKIALVGKGITFDSGGLSLKPPTSMENMKYDMAGAACVIGAMKAIAKLCPEVNVTGYVAATENMPGGNALHPGDVIVSRNGKTVEVNNTDAEGRLILADALSYAVDEKPDLIIDLATLTGACVTALGRVAAGIMGNNQKLIDEIIKTGSEHGEKFWQLPMFEEYKESLKSDVADLKNAGARGEAGTSCAAMFLQEFVDKVNWAHLDIAGPGWSDKDKDELCKGGTAFGVRTLCHFILGSN